MSFVPRPSSPVGDSYECGNPVVEDVSPGVLLHFGADTPDGIDQEIDAQHVVRLELFDEGN